jgi:hypothetical protein
VVVKGGGGERVNRGFGVRATAHSGWDINSEVGNNQPDGGRAQWHGAVYSTGRQRSQRPAPSPPPFPCACRHRTGNINPHPSTYFIPAASSMYLFLQIGL